MTRIEAAIQEYRAWCLAMNITNLEDLDTAIKAGRGIELINLCEARQERQYAGIANQIYWNRDSHRIVMMSGPSSSGKTSSALRIAQQCRVVGLTPKVIELDNYFVNREDTPKDENGEYDFEALGAMDIDLLGRQLGQLLAGKTVELPKYDFIKGRKVPSGRTMTLEKNDILMMEGIHALNPALTPAIDRSNIFTIYISALTSLPGGEKVHGTTATKRLLRRIVRDNRTRGISPEDTLMRWPSVRAGEEKNIFPFEGNAETVFNSTTLYDIPLLKYYAAPLLESIAESSPVYERAREVIDLLDRVTALKPAEIAAVPPTSIMREFIGGQTL
ncbi:MAG: nucleoside kinase [Bacteroidales bacterium]|nr:nucleoside kinase [Bacteroidales bacterium]